MPVLGFVNELSMPNAAVAAPVAADAMQKLARAVLELRRWRPDFVLQTHESIRTWRLGDHYTFSDFMSAPATRDLARLVISTINRAPIRYGLDPAWGDQGNLEYTLTGRPAEGLGLAHLFDGIAISFSVGAAWELATLDIDRNVLEEEADGTLAINTSPVSVRHVSLSSHVATHRPWLNTAGKSLCLSFEEFQIERVNRLSRIDFLDSALGQLSELNPAHPWWSAVMTRLDELQEAVIEWDPAKTPQPAWRSHVTGEMERRRRLCNFLDRDGQTRCFDQHARFTPGAGRLHFRLDGGAIKLVVAHIGQKLE